MSVELERVTYVFTIPGSDPAAFGGSIPVHCMVHVLANSNVEVGLSHRPGPGAELSLNLKQFNQLRAKIFEVTGKVV